MKLKNVVIALIVFIVLLLACGYGIEWLVSLTTIPVKWQPYITGIIIVFDFGICGAVAGYGAIYAGLFLPDAIEKLKAKIFKKG